MHNGGDESNTFLGRTSGNFTNTGTASVGLGAQALSGLTTGDGNTIIGAGSGSNITTGGANTSLGFFALENNIVGTNNIALGNSAGSALLGSSNIDIGNIGVAGDNHIMRLGTQGSGLGQINQTYVAGIYQTTNVDPYEVVTVSSVGKLGSFKGTDGQILIGSTAGSPSWGNITAGAGITITNGSNSIIITNTGGGGGGGAQNFLTQSGTAIAGSIVP
jgi:hypothetical protein